MNDFIAQTPQESLSTAQQILEQVVAPSVAWGAETGQLLFACIMFAAFIGWFLSKL